MSAKPHDAAKDLDLETSVAGEEDPGASNEVGSAVESPTQSPSTRSGRPKTPGDQASPAKPDTGDA